MEVVNSLFEYNGFKLEDIEEMRQLKAIKRGGFQKRIVLDSVTGWLINLCGGFAPIKLGIRKSHMNVFLAF